MASKNLRKIVLYLSQEILAYLTNLTTFFKIHGTRIVELLTHSFQNKNFSKSIVTWKQLAKFDQQLNSNWVDTNSSHMILIEGEEVHNDNITSMHKIFDDEYGKSMLSVEYKTVSYLPIEHHVQLGLYTKPDIQKGDVINGAIGFFADSTDAEIIPGFNDVSVLCSKMRDEQWLMLGPISFINASCRSNVEYRQKSRLVVCVATKNISTGKELTISHNRHYFGKFNINCLCPYKSEHGEYCPNDP